MLNLSSLFNIANFYVLPFWTLMILLPRWGITKKVMESFLLFLPLIGLYIYLFATSLDPQSADVWSNPNLNALTTLFSQETVMFAGWVHFLVIDLFVGRYIYLAGEEKKVPTTHSLILCLFAGPIGLLSHIITCALKNQFFSSPPSITEIQTES